MKIDEKLCWKINLKSEENKKDEKKFSEGSRSERDPIPIAKKRGLYP
jgi:hypothetical protein